MSRSSQRALQALALLCVLLVAASALVWWLNVRGEPDLSAAAPAAPASAGQVQRGAYLAQAGNCMGCHTSRGGTPYAGGAAIPTPFGLLYGSNLTPDREHGIGAWSPTEFWRALHHGRSRDGRLLYPAFPYTSFTQVTREDADALFAYLQSLPASPQPNRAHALRWPYDQQAALAVWRALFFRAGEFRRDPSQTAAWNRGAYLVRGLGHCAACHTARNTWGAPDDSQALAGGLIPMQNWYAPALTSASEAGVADWPQEDVVALLHTGVSPRGWVTGPMAEVVLRSTQHLSQADLSAMAGYLRSLPQTPARPTPARVAPTAAVATLGAKLYEQNCAQCHGDDGRGAGGVYPPLAGNRGVTMASTANLVQVVLHGGFAPATAGNPRPYGMPPYVLALSDSDIAAVLTHVRGAWGNSAPAVSELDVTRLRSTMQR
ncbi:cytochrome c [Pseudorhodoferax sp. Leaf267]|uniref:cytochrome c n=1 Tax=Pseudorhodoferax sp. Leaf267 TaxID=1736316 RepID=UPI0006FFE7C1|nr:cytochrome c [Pseudorhodoferax sp. Leaf267]KQP13067.1 alcohol dehydrogenase [Pseudorhodoferax sp. Leaf267]